MRDHGFGLRVGVGTDIMNSLRAAAGAAPVLKPNTPVAPNLGADGSTVSLQSPTGKPDSKLAADEIKLASTGGHASTKHFSLWKSFQEKFVRQFHFTREEKVLSSSEIVNAARVVQNRRR